MVGVSVEIEGATTRFEDRITSGAATQIRTPTGYERLKPGPGQSPAAVHASQRSRLHQAIIELAAEAGHDKVTVRSLTRTAGISSRTFYLHFDNREECLTSAIDAVGHELLRRAAGRASAGAGWDGRVRASLASLLEDLAHRPKVARVLLIESLSAECPSRMRAKALTAGLERLVEQLLTQHPRGFAPPHPLVRGIAAGVVRVATVTTLTDKVEELACLSSDLADWAVRVYGKVTTELSVSRRGGNYTKGRREVAPLPTEMSSMAGYGDHERILATVSRLAAERGFEGLSVSTIRREAGVSRRAFDARFASTSECFLAAVESLACVAARKAAAWAADLSPGEDPSYRRMLALCVIAARNQSLARLVLAEILAPGREGLLGRERLISAAVEQLAGTEPHDPVANTVGIEASVAGAWRIAEYELLADNGSRLPQAARLLSSLCASDFVSG
jgi:AcrR family transcriptional regulator